MKARLGRSNIAHLALGAWTVIRFALAAALVLGGCQRGPATGTTGSGLTGSAPTIQPGGELVFAFDGAALTQFGLDPHKSAFAPHNRVFRSIFDSLVVALPDHTVGPWLAESWTISPDRRVYTFTLRTDVKFHDGTPFNAEAVRFNLDRIKNPKNAFTSASDIGPYDHSEVVDPRTVRVFLSTPFEPFLINLSKSCLGIVSPAGAAKYGDQFPVNPVGSGPFRFVSLTPGTEIRLERNPDYQWAPAGAAHTGQAYLDRLTFKNVPEEATRVAALQSRQAQAADIIPPQNILAFRGDPAYQLIERELLNENYSLYLNITRPPWDDENLRQAFRLSLDLDAVVKTVYLGTFARAWSPISPSIFGYDSTLEGSWAPDPARAAQLLDAAGWKLGADGLRQKDGKPLTVVFIDTQGNREKRLDVITMVRQQLGKNGIGLKIDTQPAGNYTQRVQHGEYDLTGGSLFAPDPDVLRRLFSPADRALTAIAKVNDPEINAWVTAAAREPDPSQRRALYRNVQHKVLDKVYAIPVYVLPYTIAAAREAHGIAIDTHGFPTFQDAWLEH
jgi:peptide/nickel transport system substrate-binding protein